MKPTSPDEKTSEEIYEEYFKLAGNDSYNWAFQRLKIAKEFAEKKWLPAEELKELFEEIDMLIGYHQTKDRIEKFEEMKQKWLKQSFKSK